MHRTFRLIAEYLAGAALSLLLMEVALHLVEITPVWRVLPVVERELGWPDPDQGYALRPNHQIINVREHRAIATTNSFGLRDNELRLAKSPGVFRVALTGDSVTEALQVGDSQTYEALSEQDLNRGLDEPAYEVLNLAMSGANLLRMYLQLTQRGVQFDPDMAVFSISFGSLRSPALADDTSHPGYVENEAGELTLGYQFRNRRSQQLMEKPIGRLFFWLMDHSRLAMALMTKIRSGLWSSQFSLLPWGNSNPTAATTLSPCDRATQLLADSRRLWKDGQPTSTARRLKRVLTDIETLSLQTGMQSVFFVREIPQPLPNCPDIQKHRTEVIKLIRHRLDQYAISFVDVDARAMAFVAEDTDLLSLRGFGRKLGGGHLNHRGHEVYGRILTDVILEAAPVKP